MFKRFVVWMRILCELVNLLFNLVYFLLLLVIKEKVFFFIDILDLKENCDWLSLMGKVFYWKFLFILLININCVFRVFGISYIVVN